jgi:hypothetical protein
LESEDESVFEDIDDFFGRLFRLSERDLQVMADTLTVRNPHDELGIRASTPPTVEEARQFRRVLQTSLNPFARKLGKRVLVEPLDEPKQNGAFRFLTVRTNGQKVESGQLQQVLLEMADRTGASIIIQAEHEALLIGILNQYRYWTRSHARLLAADILRDFFSAFEGLESS